jgi:poly(3-hydroxybutyrate) depolymerase
MTANKLDTPEANLKHTIWEEYRQEQRLDERRIREHQEQRITYRDKTMHYHVVKQGKKPEEGYPLYIALHGGGGESSEHNNDSWERMKKRYLSGIRGIYVVPRSITDTWDMHFQPESYVLYDRLIENMLLFEEVCSDRVYLLGYSAGGDGVYQIASRMPDRWAAVNMSAGHPNNVDLRNLSSVPIALQAGEHDDAYNRNNAAVEMGEVLDTLAKENGGYIHTTWIHHNKGHRFVDNDGVQSVLATPGTVECDTNAIHWLDRFVRNPRPQRLIWDLKTRADRGQHYWVDIGNHTAETLGVDTIIVAIENNVIRVEKAGVYLRILVDREMLDLEKPVNVQVDGRIYSVVVRPSRRTQMETVRQRGDPRYIFDGSIILRRSNSVINVDSS